MTSDNVLGAQLGYTELLLEMIPEGILYGDT